MGCGASKQIPPWMESPPQTPIVIEIKTRKITPPENYLEKILRIGTVPVLDLQGRPSTDSKLEMFDDNENNSILWNGGKRHSHGPGKFSDFKGLKRFLSLQEGVLQEESRSESTLNFSD